MCIIGSGCVHTRVLPRRNKVTEIQFGIYYYREKKEIEIQLGIGPRSSKLELLVLDPIIIIIESLVRSFNAWEKLREWGTWGHGYLHGFMAIIW